MNIDKSIDKNIEYIEKAFFKCGDIVKNKFIIGFKQKTKIYIVYTDGLTDAEMINERVLRPLLNGFIDLPNYNIIEYLEEKKLETPDYSEVNEMQDVITEILSGNTAMFIDGYNEVIIFSSKKFPSRGVSESESEAVMRGSKDSFNESLRTNTGLIRRRIRDERLKVEQIKIGVRSKTDVAIMYVDGLVKPNLLKELKEEIDKFEIDAIFDSGMIEQLVEKNWYSPFPQFQHTERPDKTASALLEGRIAIIVDNSPDALILPTTFNCFFQASDDYYSRWEVATFARILRYIGGFLAISLPALYIALTTFHTAMLPTSLVLSFASARAGVPFPAIVEILIMEIEFELLREAGIRLPGQMGGTIGIVGGLIVGQAAVDANLVSNIVVIVVALTAICSFSIPNESFTSTFRLLKFFILIFSAIWGLFGFCIAFLILMIHLGSLESYGVPYMMPTVASEKMHYNDKKDYILRLPTFFMKKRPIFTKDGNKVRLKNKKIGK